MRKESKQRNENCERFSVTWNKETISTKTFRPVQHALNVAPETKGTAYKMRHNDVFYSTKLRLFLSDMQHSTLSILSLIITNSILVPSCRLRVTRIHLNHRIKYLNWHHHSIVHARISLFNTAFVVFFSFHAEESKRVIWRCFALILVSKFKTVKLSETLGQNDTIQLNIWERTIRSWQRFAVMQRK